jgi:hypothetical protein
VLCVETEELEMTTSTKSFPASVAGNYALELTLRYLRSVRFNWADDDQSFTVTAHPHEYRSAMTALKNAVDAEAADKAIRAAEANARARVAQ